MEPTTLLFTDPTSAEPAIIAESGAVTISHRALGDQVERLAETLRRTGLHPGDAVALVLPNGLELIVLFLALARAGLIAAPLNPVYKRDELRGFIADVEARAVVAGSGDGAVMDAAAGLAVPILTCSVAPSGEVLLGGIRPAARGTPGSPSADDVVLFLHT